MQETSNLYKDLYNSGATGQCRLLIGSRDASIDSMVAYSAGVLRQIKTVTRTFSEDSPTVGECVSAEIRAVMHKPEIDPPKMGKMIPQIRLTNGYQYSEWLSKGVFFIDTRAESDEKSELKLLTLTGFDAILATEQDYPSSSLSWPAKDIDVVREIARFIGVDIDPRTVALMANAYDIQYPGGEYSCRETLGNIAALYGGNFIMNDVGQLRLVLLNGMPRPTRYLVDNTGAAITFGGVRILV